LLMTMLSSFFRESTSMGHSLAVRGTDRLSPDDSSENP